MAEDETMMMGIYDALLRGHGVAFDAGEYSRSAGLPDRGGERKTWEAI